MKTFKTLFLILIAASLLEACTKSDDLIAPQPQPQKAEGFVAISTEYTDAGVKVKADSVIKVCSASGDYLSSLKNLYGNKKNDTLRGFYNYKVMEYKFTAPYCK